MLEIVNYGQDEYNFPCLLVLGCFDGLHIGHADLLKKAKLQAKINGLDLGVMMFADGKGGKQLYSFEERLAYLENFNVKFVLKIDYNETFMQIKPLDFLAAIEEKLNLKAYMSGKDFRFGQGKKGKSSTLKSYADDEENSVWYMSVKDVTVGDQKVSTTLIKEMLASGDIVSANELLGRNYSVKGKVEHGADRGGKLLRCPTMNVSYPENKFEIKHGVYKVKCTVGENTYEGVANYGERPTFEEYNPVLEVYAEGLDGEHYGEEVTVEFVSFLREIQKFDNAEQLATQLENDINGAPCETAQTELAATSDEPKQDEEQDTEHETQVETAAEPEQTQEDEFEEELNEQIPPQDEEQDTEHETQVETAEEIEQPQEEQEEQPQPEQQEDGND